VSAPTLTRRTEPPTIGANDAWRASPAGFSRKIDGLIWPAHLRLVSQVMVLVATKRIRRLAVSMPPGHAKSQAIMRTFPAWSLDLWPNRKIIAASYGGALAVDHSEAVRNALEHNSQLLRVRLGTSQAKDSWKTTAGGGMHAAGIGGAITGRRANVGLIDDPFKSADDAHSEKTRESVWSFWTTVMRTRLIPGSPAVVIQTRWHEEDLIGRLMTQDDRHQWVSLRLPAIAEEDETIETVLGVETCERLRREGIVLPEWHRKAGAALWPTNLDPESGELIPWYDEEEMATVRADIGEYSWAGLYQQRPSPSEGEMFWIGKWDRADEIPPETPMIRAWDLAATEGGGDETVGALVTRDRKGYVYVVDIVHGRWADSQVEEIMKATARADQEKYGRRVRQKIEQEPGSGGKAWARRLVREVLAGYSAYAEGSSGDKPTRARALASQQQAGFVKLVRVWSNDAQSFGPAPWFDALTEQARVFPHGKHDDIVDAVSAAYNELVGRRSRTTASSAARKTLPS
jgi:predicted phage terminase large subunit-like protein